MKLRYRFLSVFLILFLPGAAGIVLHELFKPEIVGPGSGVPSSKTDTPVRLGSRPVPRFRPPAFTDVRIMPGARPGAVEWYERLLATPEKDWDGPVPASLADLPAATREALGPKAANAEVNLAFLAALNHCLPKGLRGAVLVDLWFEKNKAVKADVEATTLAPEHDKEVARCVAEAHVGRYLLPGLPGPDPDPTSTSTVFPMVIQLPVKNTYVYQRLANYVSNEPK